LATIYIFPPHAMWIVLFIFPKTKWHSLLGMWQYNYLLWFYSSQYSTKFIYIMRTIVMMWFYHRKNCLHCTFSRLPQHRSLERLCLFPFILPHCQMWPITCPICSENLHHRCHLYSTIQNTALWRHTLHRIQTHMPTKAEMFRGIVICICLPMPLWIKMHLINDFDSSF